MLKKLMKENKGFTLIEIVLVLAIAGLILVVVFLAVGGAQRARRDTQRRNDVARISAMIETFASNNNGIYPTAAEFKTGVFKTKYFDVDGNLKSPTTNTAYSLADGDGAASALDTVYYAQGGSCGSGGIVSAPGSSARIYAVGIGLESGANCIASK